ncbi:MAG TPA: ATP-dependent Clp protease proteolytic subunit, partial [Cyclobacteriaceae bacterium]|nr:ATP-dependent Clp protease proteolytic subunit [Cyclobacteriaceae bacterium]
MNNQNEEFRKYAVHHLGMSGNTLDDYAKKMGQYSGAPTLAMTPNVIEERQMRATVIDVFSR